MVSFLMLVTLGAGYDWRRVLRLLSQLDLNTRANYSFLLSILID